MVVPSSDKVLSSSNLSAGRNETSTELLNNGSTDGSKATGRPKLSEKYNTDLYTRTSWVDANIALDQIHKGKAEGRRSAIYMRSILQSHFDSIGLSIQKHAGKILFVAILVFSTFCVGLKSATMHSKVQNLWIQEGGRLEKELLYTQKSVGETETTSHLMMIQISKDPSVNILHPQALLTHLDVLKQAASVKIEMYDVSWSLRDMCNVPSIPAIEPLYVEQIIDNILPCVMVTPLDCFWEGSKLLGPVHPVPLPNSPEKVQWTSLNPQRMIHTMKENNTNYFAFDIFEQYMKRAGITVGYTEKPCLNPLDKQCPVSAPNSHTSNPPDIGAELTGGCYSYAAEYMHWPEELIVGGVRRNKSRHVREATALQTVIQLMTERELYESWDGHYRVHQYSWSPEKAGKILRAWQKKFSNEVKQIMAQTNPPYEIFAFSSATLDDILEKYTNLNPFSIGVGVAVTVIYTAIALIRWRHPLRSQSAVGIAGVLLMAFSTAAGLGLCALLGMIFNAATIQVIPFMALGLGVDHIFLLTRSYADSSTNEQTETILKKAGPNVLFSAATTIGSFFTAGLIPVPALKVFSLQSAIIMTFNLGAALLVFPAMISLDLRRRASGRSDIFCCIMPKHKPVNNLHLNHDSRKNNLEMGKPQEQTLLCSTTKKSFISFRFSNFVGKYYVRFITCGFVKSFGVLCYLGFIIFCMFSTSKLQDGLDLIDLVPKDTVEHKFLKSQSTMFGFYNMFAVTQGDFEYPTNQKLLYEYHDAYVRISHVIKNDNGGVSNFWLSLFRDWLRNIQDAFDRDYSEFRITTERWFPNASSDGILGYRLLVQTGHVDIPVDKSLLLRNRLVDSEGIINPKAFYIYLSAWASNDVFSYSASQGKLRPEPREWFHQPTDYELKIPKSQPLVYTQLPFYLRGLTDTSQIKILISQVRDLCEKFEQRGLPNYPSGIPFLFWEQYINLRFSISLLVGCVIAIAFTLCSLLLLSFHAAILVMLNAVVTVVELLGIMTLLKIKFSVIPSVILVLSVGLSVGHTIHIALGFITGIGSPVRRLQLSLEMSFGPIFHSIITTTITAILFIFSPFEYIVHQIMWLFLAALLVGLLNGLFFFPILLYLSGPKPELVPLEHEDRISTPTPPVQRHKHSKKINNYSSYSSRDHKSQYNRNINLQNEPSLTTITEEPQSWKSSNSSISTASNILNPPPQSKSSHNDKHSSTIHSELQSIVVQPEVTVETHHNGTDQGTKVTATANIKVELVTPGRATRTYHRSS